MDSDRRGSNHTQKRVNRGIRIIATTCMQVLLAFVFVTYLWRVGVWVYPPQGSNWMWQEDRYVFIAEIGIIVLLGNIWAEGNKVENSRALYWSMVAQVLVLIFVRFSRFDYQPLRTGFLLSCGVITILSPLGISSILYPPENEED